MKYRLACLLLLYPLAAAAQAPGTPKSVSDCERIKNDLAYNQCLASFGPKHGERGANSGEGSDDGPAARPTDRSAQSARRSRNGRQSAVFDLNNPRGATGRSRNRR